MKATTPDLATFPPTIGALNAALKGAGLLDVFAAQGRGYVYFRGPGVEMCFAQSAEVYRPYSLSYGEWIELAKEKRTESEGHKALPGMDDFTERHLQAWLENTVLADEREQVGATIRKFVAEHPDVLERGNGWPEVRMLAERVL